MPPSKNTLLRWHYKAQGPLTEGHGDAQDGLAGGQRGVGDEEREVVAGELLVFVRLQWEREGGGGGE